MDREYRFLMAAEAGEPAREMRMVCLDDEAAMLLGERFAMRRSVEVWCGGRFVGTAEPEAAPAASAPPADGSEAAASAPSGEPARRRLPFWAGAWRRGLEESA